MLQHKAPAEKKKSIKIVAIKFNLLHISKQTKKEREKEKKK